MILTLFLQMKKLTFKDIKEFSQSHIAIDNQIKKINSNIHNSCIVLHCLLLQELK